ncbi:MAG: S8 family serine peptidase [Methanobacteriota archaeon]
MYVTNVPVDEVDYGHGTGEAHDSAGEAGNADGFPGTCPSCRFLPLRVGESFIAHDEDYAQAVLYAVDAGASVVQEALGTVDNVLLARDAHRYAWERGVPIVASAADEAAYHHNFPSGHDYTINVNSIRTGAEVGGFPLQPHPRSFLYVNGCTNFGGNVWASVSSTSCSSEATGRSAGIAGLVESHARNLAARGNLTPHPDAGTFPSGNVLSAAEVRQLFRLGADDIDLSTKREVASPIPTVRYASQPGWDQYTGWGRINAEKLLRLLDQGRVPPEVAITAPGWWAPVDALQTHEVEVTWEIGVRRVAGAFAVELSFGCGVQPLVFVPVRTEDGLAPAARTETEGISTSQIAAVCAITPRPPVGPNDFTVTIRVRATDAAGNVGEDRRTIHVAMDPTLLPDWPRLLEGSGESSADLVDLDGDGADEIVVPTSAGILHAFRSDGSEAPGFPVTTDPLPGLHAGAPVFASGRLVASDYYDSLSQGATAIGDMDDAGDLEIVATSLNGFVYAWNSGGSRLPGFPVEVVRAYSAPGMRDRYNTVIGGFEAAPTLADLDGDGDLEIVASAMDRHVYAWHHTGAPVPGFPAHLVDTTKMDVDPVTHRVAPKANVSTYRGAQIVSTTAVGELDGDPSPEIVVGANEHYPEDLAVSSLSLMSSLAGTLGLDVGNGRLYALEANGTVVPGWPVKVPVIAAELLPYVGEGVPGSPALADLDADGRDEVAIFATAGPVMVYRGDGSGFYGNDLAGRPIGLSMEAVGPGSGAIDVPLIPGLGSPAIGRVAPGAPAIVVPAAGLGRALDVLLPGEQVVSQDYVQAWDGRTGAVLPAFPRPIEDLQFITTPAIMNVDADPAPEVVEGSGGYLLHAWKASGVEAVGFPKSTNHWLIGTAAVGDVDGDGLREVVETSREGWLWVWKTTAVDAASVDEWWSDHHDEANTGRWTAGPVLGVSGAAPATGAISLQAIVGVAVVLLVVGGARRFHGGALR